MHIIVIHQARAIPPAHPAQLFVEHQLHKIQHFSFRCKDKITDFIIQKSLESQFEYATRQLLLGSAAAVSYAAALWWLKETLRDMGYRYIDIKQEYVETKDDLLKSNYLSEKEAQVCAFIQALSRVPDVYWREIIATAITVGLFKTGYYFHQKM